jgi:hypothetical protein
MSTEVQIGTVLISQWPPLFGLESEPYSGHWSTVNTLDGFALERKVRAAGWNFFFLAAEVKVMFLGALGAKKIQDALLRILAKVSRQDFNSLEVTGIVAKRFLGIPYAVVSAHSRHVQKSCYLEPRGGRS